ncbi:hypothetical protein [Gephyromycinifex aptenodytis]|uniref:hypothetical protein n=1 Tax=Gephyromycinifex aptenodytis TaxID=2716227 RepID=UPI0014467E55|nr:hypothetical protein [Gephyromycinifex aptenodytis]
MTGAAGRARIDLRGVTARAAVQRLENALLLPAGALVELEVDHDSPWTPSVAEALGRVAPRLAWAACADLSDHRNAAALAGWVHRLRAVVEGAS